MTKQHNGSQSEHATSTTRDSDGESKQAASRGDELPSCQVAGKSRSGISPIMSGQKGRSPPLGRGSLGLSSQCQYLPQSASPYLQGASSPSCDQVYYPHHSATTAGNMAAMQMANTGLLQQTTVGSSLLNSASSALSLSHMGQQMGACQLAGQNSACALAQGSTSGSGAYGLPGSGNQGSLSSCTYMQSSQPYPSHLSMNLTSHFPNPMAWFNPHDIRSPIRLFTSISIVGIGFFLWSPRSVFIPIYLYPFQCCATCHRYEKDNIVLTSLRRTSFHDPMMSLHSFVNSGSVFGLRIVPYYAMLERERTEFNKLTNIWIIRKLVCL